MKTLGWMIVMSLHLASIGAPQAHEAEVYRRGDLIQLTGGAAQASSDDRLADALAPPADDSDKWFISVITTEGCLPCERLKQDFESGDLRAWHRDADDRKAWAHLNYYRAEEKRFAWRFEHVKIHGFPCIVVQPPKNGSWGPNETIAVQIEGYDGDAAKLSQLLRLKLKEYVTKMERKSGSPFAEEFVSGAQQKVTIPPPPDAAVAPSFEEFVEACPGAPLEWLLRMKQAGVAPATAKMLWQQEQAKRPEPTPTPKPTPEVAPTKPIVGVSGTAMLLSVLLSVNGLHFLMKLWEWYRAGLRSTGRTPLIPDEVKEMIERMLQDRVFPDRPAQSPVRS